MPWNRYEQEYAAQFSSDTGHPAIPYRMAAGTLIIKQMTGGSDEDTLQSILENPYMQYLIGLHEFVTEPPFSSSSITNFRKYISAEMLNKINQELFGGGRPESLGAADEGESEESEITQEISPSQETDTSKEEVSAEPDQPTGKSNCQVSIEPLPNPKYTPLLNRYPYPEIPTIPYIISNKGQLILDATCAPAYITYPTDVNLLNEAREKLEEIIDTLHPYTLNPIKPRTYRQEARKRYIDFIKNKKPAKRKIRKAIGQQLRYVKRDLSHIDKQLEQASSEMLSNRQLTQLATIRLLYVQQETMYVTKTHSIDNRIVSISQPHVRPRKSQCNGRIWRKNKHKHGRGLCVYRQVRL
jgi:hypothetical protein